MYIGSLLDFVKLHGQPRYVNDFTDKNGKKFSALSFDAKSFTADEIRTYTDSNGEIHMSAFVMVSFAPTMPDISMRYIQEHYKELQVREVLREGKMSFVLEPIMKNDSLKPQKEVGLKMTKKKFHIILILAIIIDFVLSIIVGVQTYAFDIKLSDPNNVTSWFSLIIPCVISYAAYRGLKYLFNKRLGLIVSITFMVVSFIFVMILPSHNQGAAAVIEALNFGLLAFSIGIICIYKILSKHFENYHNLE